MPHAELRDLLQQRGCRWLVADDRECHWTRAGWSEATVPVNQQCHRSAQDSAVAQIQTVRGVCISETQWCTPPQHASKPFCGALNVSLQSAQSVDGHCGLGWWWRENWLWGWIITATAWQGLPCFWSAAVGSGRRLKCLWVLWASAEERGGTASRRVILCLMLTACCLTYDLC